MLSRILSLFTKNPSIKLNVLVYKEEKEWIAHCLQMDLVAANDDRDTVQDDIIDLIKSHVIYALENDNIDHIFKPAPSEEWEKLAHSQKCGSRKVTIKPPKRDNGIQSIPINEVELCFA